MLNQQLLKAQPIPSGTLANPQQRFRTSRSCRLCSSYRRGTLQVTRASNEDSTPANADTNELQTALNNAIAAEAYGQAAEIRDKLQKAQASEGNNVYDWESVGVPAWLAQRAGQLGYRFPNELQRRCCLALSSGKQDVVIQSETGSGKTLAFLMPLLARLDYPPDLFPEDLVGPEMIILTPSLELGAQQAMVIYKLFGGSVNPGIPGASANMFAYTGPRGLKVRGLLNDEEVLMSKTIGYMKGVHVLVATPEKLAEALELPEFSTIFDDLRAMAVDEVDACFQDQTQAMEKILTAACASSDREKPVMAFVGATVDDRLADQAAQMGWLTDVTIIASQHFRRVPRGLKHRYIKVDQDRMLSVLSRQLKADIQQQDQDKAPPRVIVFAQTTEEAVAAASPLRNALWGKHRLAVLLPSSEEPLKAMHAFRDNAATFLLATPAASRGLDLPAVSHVYNLGCPDATSYLHRAGRAGRIGSPIKGLVTTVITPDQEEGLKAVAKELGIELQEEPALPADGLPDPEQDIEGAKQGLEDIFNLM